MDDAIVKKKQVIRELFIIALVTLAIHGFMMALTGTFWDDWISLFKDKITKDIEGIESGRPYYAWVIELVWWLPGYSYRVVVFLTYLASYIFLYAFLKKVFAVYTSDDKAALCITLLCVAVPINDAKVLLANYPYAVGYMFFFLGLFLLESAIEKSKKRSISYLFSGVAFFCCFTLNSNLVMYGLVLLFIVVRQRKVRKIVAFWPFFVLPFVFWFGNKLLFPTCGSFENYNTVTLHKLVNAIVLLPKAAINTGKAIFRLWLFNSKIVIGIVVAVGILIFDVIKKKKNKSLQFEKFRLGIFALGILAYLAGLFSYVVVRQSDWIGITGVNSRDSMQLGLGIALILYSLFGRRVRKYVFVVLIVSGFLCTNVRYLRYQGDWYRQYSFQQHLRLYSEKNAVAGNYIIVSAPETQINGDRFYSWSANGIVATGCKNLFLVSDSDRVLVEDIDSKKIFAEKYPCLFKELDCENKDVAGVINFEFNELTLMEIVRCKYMELTNKSVFVEKILRKGEFSVLIE